MQLFELNANLAQRETLIRCVDAGDKRHQPIFRQPGLGLFQQARVGEMLSDQKFDCPAQAFRRQVDAALPQDACNVVPGVIGAHPRTVGSHWFAVAWMRAP